MEISFDTRSILGRLAAPELNTSKPLQRQPVDEGDYPYSVQDLLSDCVPDPNDAWKQSAQDVRQVNATNYEIEHHCPEVVMPGLLYTTARLTFSRKGDKYGFNFEIDFDRPRSDEHRRGEFKKVQGAMNYYYGCQWHGFPAGCNGFVLVDDRRAIHVINKLGYHQIDMGYGQTESLVSAGDISALESMTTEIAMLEGVANVLVETAFNHAVLARQISENPMDKVVIRA